MSIKNSLYCTPKGLIYILNHSLKYSRSWSVIKPITKVNFDTSALGFESQTCIFLTKDNLHTLSYKIAVIKWGSLSFLLSSFLFPSSLYHQDLQPTGYLWMDLFQFSLPNWPRLTRIVPWSQLVGENGDPLVFLDTLGHASCLVCEGGGKKEDPNYLVLPFIYS